MGFSGLFAIGVSGVQAQATGLEAISNNIANSQTTGYRRAAASFAQLVTGTDRAGEITTGPGRQGEGQGVAARLETDHHLQGLIRRTDTDTHLAISGRGFFAVEDPGLGSTDDNVGNTLFTRAGDFQVSNAGVLVNSAGQTLLGVPLSGANAGNGAGAIASLGALEPIDPSQATGRGAATEALSVSLAGNSSGERTVQLFDATGAVRTLTVSLVPQDDTSATLTLTDGQTPLATGTIVFDRDGAPNLDASTLPESFTIDGQSVALALTQDQANGAFSSGFAVSQRGGTAFGTVTGFQIDESGVLRATLSNGLSDPLYQIPLALFTNAEGLIRADDTAFRFDPQAGTLTLTTANTNGAGLLEASALENSTVDITQSFSLLIETQRAYAANAQILSVTDELLETLNGTAA
ncbi:MAG: flagellar hook-basal body complex protein [Pseudomonadota bacterium]